MWIHFGVIFLSGGRDRQTEEQAERTSERWSSTLAVSPQMLTTLLFEKALLLSLGDWWAPGIYLPASVSLIQGGLQARHHRRLLLNLGSRELNLGPDIGKASI